MSGYSNTIEAIAWFNAYIVDGCDTEPVPANWDQYLHEAEAYYAIAHGADAETLAHGDGAPDCKNALAKSEEKP